jgi:hypothetical protein
MLECTNNYPVNAFPKATHLPMVGASVEEGSRIPRGYSRK